MKEDIERAKPFLNKGDCEQYPEMVTALGGFVPNQRGSGSKTAILASALALLSKGNVENAVTVAANALGSDTDTIATMVGALVGTISPSSPQYDLMDSEYITKETTRLQKISEGTSKQDFVYPDLLHWDPSSSPLDNARSDNGILVFSAFGKIVPSGEEYLKNGRYPVMWKWYQLKFGQHVLIKHRDLIRPVDQTAMSSSGYYRSISTPSVGSSNLQAASTQPLVPVKDKKLTVDDAFAKVLDTNFSPEVIGKLLLEITDSDNDIERAIAFSAIVSKARQERKRRQQRS